MVKTSTELIVLLSVFYSTIPQAPMVEMIVRGFLHVKSFGLCFTLSNFAIVLITYNLDYAKVFAKYTIYRLLGFSWRRYFLSQKWRVLLEEESCSAVSWYYAADGASECSSSCPGGVERVEA